MQIKQEYNIKLISHFSHDLMHTARLLNYRQDDQFQRIVLNIYKYYIMSLCDNHQNNLLPKKTNK